MNVLYTMTLDEVEYSRWNTKRTKAERFFRALATNLYLGGTLSRKILYFAGDRPCNRRHPTLEMFVRTFGLKSKKKSV